MKEEKRELMKKTENSKKNIWEPRSSKGPCICCHTETNKIIKIGLGNYWKCLSCSSYF